MKVISKFIKYCKLSWQLQKATWLADKLQKQTGVTQYVVKAGDNLVVMTRKQYRDRCALGKARCVTNEQMYQGCFYCTRWYRDDNPTPYKVVLRKKRMWLAANGI